MTTSPAALATTVPNRSRPQAAHRATIDIPSVSIAVGDANRPSRLGKGVRHHDSTGEQAQMEPVAVPSVSRWLL